MKIYVLAGEASGDIHGASLIHSFIEQYPTCQIRGMGGKNMQLAGCEIAFDYQAFSVMGFIEVFRQFRRIQKHFKRVENDVRKFHPDVIVFIDYPGFNLRLAKRLYKDFSLHYYIAPKAWAWNKSRVKLLRNYFKTVNCILPFEESFFKSYKVHATYVGNPSKALVENHLKTHNKSIDSEKYIALFPGSRIQEIERILPVMLEALRSFPEMGYKISKASNLPSSLYKKYITSEEELIEDNYTLLLNAKLALVTSGTATLETALFGIPQVVCYIANPISYFIAKRLVKLKYISLVNLIMDKEVVKELIQDSCNTENIQKFLSEIMEEKQAHNIQQEYNELAKRLGTKNASVETVKNISATIEK